MKKNYKKYIKKLIEYGIYILLIYFIYSKLNGNIQKLLQYDMYSPMLLFVPIFIITTLTMINGVHWNRLMRLENEKTGLLEQMSVYVQSYILRYIPGNVVGIASRGVLNKKYGVSMSKSIWGWFVENLYYLIVGIVLGLYVLMKRLGVLAAIFDFSSQKDLFIVAIVIFLIISTLLLGGVVFFRSELLIKLFNKVSRFILPKKYKDSKVENSSISLKGRIELLVRYLLSWVIYLLSFLFVTFAVTGVFPSYLLEFSSAVALAWSIGYLFIITPSGTGVREIVLITLLPLVGSFSFEESVIIALAARVIGILGELLAFAVVKILVSTSNGKK